MENKDQVFSELDQLFTSFYRNMSSALGDKISGNITVAQLHTLKLIAFGLDTVRDLAQKMNISPAAVSKMVEQLVQSDLICRIRSGEDRRILQLELTQQGKAILQENMDKRRDLLKEILSTFTQEEIIKMKELLEKTVLRLQGAN